MGRIWGRIRGCLLVGIRGGLFCLGGEGGWLGLFGLACLEEIHMFKWCFIQDESPFSLPP